jgi:hypothetical protein
MLQDALILAEQRGQLLGLHKNEGYEMKTGTARRGRSGSLVGCGHIGRELAGQRGYHDLCVLLASQLA